VGIATSLEAGRLTSDLLSEIKPLDLAIVVALLLAVAAFACFVPACHPSRLDPTQALRAK
jgi:putative ABC transport system permease protein